MPFDDFVRHHLGERPGEIREAATGEVLGMHSGTWFHTIGQRRGLGLGTGPWYVVGKDHPNNVVTVVHADRLTEFHRHTFRIPLPHWIAGPPSTNRLEVKIRHGQRTDPCVVDFDNEGGLTVGLVGTQDPGIAPGQFAALYDGEECLGGGVME